ncbi:hypothetical protein [Salaquimonas pukyongi]|uniref:hypothetical protein n=1 Tax=Salaquimonas pukyongi TaxID=2712698 RepID=UPI0019675452|nr:hypothetical protein [Salaquimonas pukyongi]
MNEHGFHRVKTHRLLSFVYIENPTANRLFCLTGRLHPLPGINLNEGLNGEPVKRRFFILRKALCLQSTLPVPFFLDSSPEHPGEWPA